MRPSGGNIIMMKITLLIASSLFAFSAAAQTVAQVGSTKISKSEFEKSYQQALTNTKSLTRPPTKKEHLEDMIRFKLGLQEAAKSKIASVPVVKKALDLTLYKGLLEVKLSKQVNKIKVSKKEMTNFYIKNPHMRLSHIFIRLPNNPSATQIKEARARANKFYTNVSGGKKKWASYVSMYSDDTSTKTKSGDLGYHSSSSLYPALYKALSSLSAGQVSKPILGLFGFHIIQKTGQLSFEKSDKSATKIAVFNAKRFRILDKYFDSLKKKYKVSHKKDLL